MHTAVLRSRKRATYDLSPVSVMQTLFMLILGAMLWFSLRSDVYTRVAKKLSDPDFDTAECTNNEPFLVSVSGFTGLLNSLLLFRKTIGVGLVGSGCYSLLLSIRNGNWVEISLSFGILVVIISLFFNVPIWSEIEEI